MITDYLKIKVSEWLNDILGNQEGPAQRIVLLCSLGETQLDPPLPFRLHSVRLMLQGYPKEEVVLYAPKVQLDSTQENLCCAITRTLCTNAATTVRLQFSCFVGGVGCKSLQGYSHTPEDYHFLRDKRSQVTIKNVRTQVCFSADGDFVSFPNGSRSFCGDDTYFHFSIDIRPTGQFTPMMPCCQDMKPMWS